MPLFNQRKATEQGRTKAKFSEGKMVCACQSTISLRRVEWEVFLVTRLFQEDKRKNHGKSILIWCTGAIRAPDTEGFCSVAKENTHRKWFFWGTYLPSLGFLWKLKQVDHFCCLFETVLNNLGWLQVRAVSQELAGEERTRGEAVWVSDAGAMRVGERGCLEHPQRSRWQVAAHLCWSLFVAATWTVGHQQGPECDPRQCQLTIFCLVCKVWRSNAAAESIRQLWTEQ